MEATAFADLASYGGLFLSAFASATLLPGTSEAVLIGLLVAGKGAPLGLLVAATAGNVIGSVLNWSIGRFLSDFRDRWWFPVKGQKYDRAVAWADRYGGWTLLLCWVPLIGDALTLAAGALRLSFGWFLLFVTLGKGGRYVFVLAAYTWWSGA